IESPSGGIDQRFGGEGFLPNRIPSRLRVSTLLDFPRRSFGEPFFAGKAPGVGPAESTSSKGPYRRPFGGLAGNSVKRPVRHVAQHHASRFGVVKLIAVFAQGIAKMCRGRGVVLVNFGNFGGCFGPEFFGGPLLEKFIAGGVVFCW